MARVPLQHEVQAEVAKPTCAQIVEGPPGCRASVVALGRVACLPVAQLPVPGRACSSCITACSPSPYLLKGWALIGEHCPRVVRCADLGDGPHTLVQPKCTTCVG
jgi:hypothetical protein